MARRDQTNASDLSEQAIALAEQLGRIAGTMEGTAEAWLRNPALTDQLTRVRDGAAEMLESLSSRARRSRKTSMAKSATKKPAARPRTDLAHAPGKLRRKPSPTMRGLKKSDERIPKLRTAAAVRQRRKSYA
jgi:hypothetical protein